MDKFELLNFIKELDSYKSDKEESLTIKKPSKKLNI